MTEINNKKVLFDLLDNLRDYGYKPVGEFKQDIELNSCYSVDVVDEEQLLAPISISILTENTGEQGLIIKAAVEIYPFTDLHKLLDMINVLNTQVALTKVILEDHGEENYYLTLSILQMLYDVKEVKIHDKILNEIGAWKGLIAYLIKNNFVMVDDEMMANYCA